jgi:hypothetical protein
MFFFKKMIYYFCGLFVKNLSVLSPAFKNKQKLPVKYTCDGKGVNPPLVIDDIPSEARACRKIGFIRYAENISNVSGGARLEPFCVLTMSEPIKKAKDWETIKTLFYTGQTKVQRLRPRLTSILFQR